MKKALITHFELQSTYKKIITVIGTGYVGLVTGACLAHAGNTVICADIDEQKINLLQQGAIPIYEPGLKEIVNQNTIQNRLSFTDNIEQAIRHAETIFICVGTPMNPEGEADMKYVHNVIHTLAQSIDTYKIIIMKSTVPIGTGKYIKNLLTQKYGISTTMFDMVSNPEFLREGSAVKDFMHADRIVVGSESIQAIETLKKIYHPFIKQGSTLVQTNIATAELTKYAANNFLAMKVSFINEIANLCDAIDADIKTISQALGLDKRISPLFLKPGPGFGGSCFPKDVYALLHCGRKYNVPLHMIQATLIANERQKHKPIEKLKAILGDNLIDKTIAILGLSFKANTDDVRYSASITTINTLINAGAIVKAYDPQATENMKKICPQALYCSSIDETVTYADALIIMTEWDEFKSMDLYHIKSLMKQPIIIDTRNIISHNMLNEAGFIWNNIGQTYKQNMQ